AGDEPPRPIGGVAVRAVGGSAKRADAAIGRRPAEQAVVGDVGPDHQSLAGQPGGALGPDAAGPDPLDGCVGSDAAAKCRIEPLDRLPGQGAERPLYQLVTEPSGRTSFGASQNLKLCLR